MVAHLCARFVPFSRAPTGVMVEMMEPVPWKPSTASIHYVEGLVTNGLLPANVGGEEPVWISLGADPEPKPPKGYIVSLARLHERGFGVPAGTLHPGDVLPLPGGTSQLLPQCNLIGRRSSLPCVRGSWESLPIWHLYRGELHTESLARGVRYPVRAVGLMLQVQERRKDLHIPYTMVTNNQDRDRRGGSTSGTTATDSRYTGKVLEQNVTP